MPTALKLNQKQRLDELVQETIQSKRGLHITKVQEELEIDFHTARTLMRPYVHKGRLHYNRTEQAYLPNRL